MHCSLKKAFLSLYVILWNSAFVGGTFPFLQGSLCQIPNYTFLSLISLPLSRYRPSFVSLKCPSKQIGPTCLPFLLFILYTTTQIICSWIAGIIKYQFSSVQSLSRVQLFATPWITACQTSLSITNSRSSLKLVFIKSVIPCSHLILCHPLLFLPPIPPRKRVFSSESTLRMRWPKYWTFSFSISPSKNTQDWSPLGCTGWISLQSKGLSSVFSNITVQKHQFFGAQLSSQSNSHIYTWPLEKTIALTRRTFGKVMSLLFNMLSRLVITFLPRSKHLLISWLQSPPAVILEPKK